MTRVRGLFQKCLKNRSSKHLRFMTGPGTKPAIWSWSNDALRKAASGKDSGNIFEEELIRRQKKRDKKAKKNNK